MIREQKLLIFVVISVLVVALMYSSVSTSGVFAVPPDDNFGGRNCVIHDDLTVTCCWQEPDLNNPGEEVSWCQTCNLDPTDCGPLRSSTGPFAPPQDGILDEPPAPPSGPAAPLQDGGVLQQTPSQGAAPPGTTAAPAPKPEVACGPPPMPACGPNSPPPPPPPPPTNHVVKGPQVGELPVEEAELPPATEETQPATVEEEQPVPVCQEGLEFNEDLGFCVPEDCPEGQVLDEESGICVLEEPEAAEDPAQSDPEEEQQPAEEEDDSEDNGNN
jgi:hypothetical protein